MGILFYSLPGMWQTLSKYLELTFIKHSVWAREYAKHFTGIIYLATLLATLWNLSLVMSILKSETETWGNSINCAKLVVDLGLNLGLGDCRAHGLTTSSFLSWASFCSRKVYGGCPMHANVNEHPVAKLDLEYENGHEYLLWGVGWCLSGCSGF